MNLKPFTINTVHKALPVIAPPPPPTPATAARSGEYEPEYRSFHGTQQRESSTHKSRDLGLFRRETLANLFDALNELPVNERDHRFCFLHIFDLHILKSLRFEMSFEFFQNIIDKEMSCSRRTPLRDGVRGFVAPKHTALVVGASVSTTGYETLTCTVRLKPDRRKCRNGGRCQGRPTPSLEAAITKEIL